ncbi:MAG: chemotaxis protein CheW [Desulfomonile sp.]|nr:chemotaxis protein CheW [Desulfomonile sp.]
MTGPEAADPPSQDLVAAPGPVANAPAGSVAVVASLDDKKRILRERAKKLAQRPDAHGRDQECLEVIEFMLAHERYAVEVNYVREVYPLKDLTRVPCVPSFVLGVINVRGQVISVVDVKEFFDLPKKELTDDYRVIIVNNEEMELGIASDSVLGERKVPLNVIQKDTSALRGLREGYIRGVTTDRLIIINIDSLLSDESIVVHQEVGA